MSTQPPPHPTDVNISCTFYQPGSSMLVFEGLPCAVWPVSLWQEQNNMQDVAGR